MQFMHHVHRFSSSKITNRKGGGYNFNKREKRAPERMRRRVQRENEEENKRMTMKTVISYLYTNATCTHYNIGHCVTHHGNGEKKFNLSSDNVKLIKQARDKYTSCSSQKLDKRDWKNLNKIYVKCSYTRWTKNIHKFRKFYSLFNKFI